MTEKDDTVLKIRVLDPQGKFLGGKVNIRFEHTRLSERPERRDVDASREIDIRGLRRGPEALYKVFVTLSEPFKQQGKFVNIPSSGFATLEFVFDRPQKPEEPKPPEGELVVRGLVRHSNGRAALNLKVRAFDRDLRNETLLGETATEGAGRYEIRYTADKLAEKGSADLIVRALDQNGRELAVSTILFNAGREATVDMVVGNEVYRGPSEYEALVETLTPLLEGLSFADLTEDDQHQDVTFLSGETGQDSGRITFLIAAHRLREATDVDAEIFYGMFRQGLPTRLPALLAQSPDVQRRAVVRAAEDNVIPPRFRDQADAIVERFKALVVSQAMKPPAGGEDAAPLSDLLGLALPNPGLRQSFFTAYVRHTGPVEKLWEELSARPDLKDHVEEVQRTLQLGTLAGNHLPLVRELRRRQQAGEIAALSDLAAIDWYDALSRDSGNGSIGAPSGVPGKDAAEKTRNYARAISHLVEDTFPTPFVANRLEASGLTGREDLRTFLGSNPGFDLRSTRLTSYLRENPEALAGVQDPEGTTAGVQALQRVYRLAPRWEQASALLADGVDSAHAVTRKGENVFVSTYGEAFGGRAAARTIYARAQQVEDRVLDFAVEFGLGSSRAPTQAVPDAAVTEVDAVPEWSTLFGSLELCGCEHCRSVYSPAAYLVDVLHFLKDRPSRRAGQKAKDVLFQRRPDLGEIELTCENTNTPLPYVDLVNETLENAVAPFARFVPFNLPAAVEADLDSHTLSQALREAFTPPLSEQAVITAGGEGRPSAADPAWWTIDEPAFTYAVRKEDGRLSVVARSRQTKGSVVERTANPQYVNDDAYAVLGRAVYPWSLPFALGAEEARSYLGHLGVSRVQIMEALHPDERAAVLEDAALAREHLGLTSAQADLITGATTSQPWAAHPGPWNLWGFESESLSAERSIPDPSDATRRIDTGHWVDALRGRVDVFLRQSGMKYSEMLELLGTYFVNPVAGSARAVRIVSTDSDHPDTCETDKLRLEGFDQETAGRTVRFVRLARVLGWSLRDLDRAVTALAPAGLDEDFLIRLSHVQRLRAALDVPVPVLLSWWADLDTGFYLDHGAPGQPRAASLYDQLFRNRATINPPDPAFTEDPASLGGTLTGHAAAITAAVGLSAADFALLLANSRVIPRSAAAPDQPDDTLSLHNLSRLHRHASLARALRLSVRESLTALELIAADPFATTRDTVIFVETVEKARGAGFTFAELDFLLRHVSTPESPVAPNDDAIATLLDELRAGLLKIAGENTFRDEPGGPATDPDGELTRRKLALLNWEPALIDQAVATLNGAVTYEAPLAALPAGLALPNAPDVWTVDLAALPAGFAIPLELRDFVAYDAAGHKLRAARFLDPPERSLLRNAAGATGDAALAGAVTLLLREQDELRGRIDHDASRGVLRTSGPMTDARRRRLRGVSDDGAYRAAVEKLHDAPRLFVRRALRGFAVQDFAAGLAALPAGVRIPGALKRKIYFDAHAGLLHCQGVLSEPERDALLALSAEAAYRAAIHSLYDQAETFAPAAPDVFLTAADSALLFDTATVPGDRFLLLLKKLLPFLRRALGERLAVRTMAEALQLETRAADALLRELGSLDELLAQAFAESNSNVQPTPAAFPVQFKTYRRLHKAAAIAARLKLSHRQLGWLFTYGPGAGWLDLGALPTGPGEPPAGFDGWLRLAELARLRDDLPQGEKALDELLALAHAVTAAAPAAGKDDAKRDWFAAVTRWTRWGTADLESLLGAAGDHRETGQLGASFPGGYAGERLLARLREAFRLLGRLGMPAGQAAGLATGDVTATDARGVRQAVRARYDDAQWLNLARPLRDVLRERQRAALAAWLVSHFRLPRNVRDADDLYSHFLIDVEMDPCMTTSRIKQAISSVQLFVQRCLMNLEEDVAASAEVDVKWREWKWMKSYRVWEANRKVFLYPENWIEPELRDGKSPFFSELESELLQSDLTRETAEEAFLHYLEKLDQVARLEVVAIHHQLETDGTGNAAVDLLHVFARTPATPHVYYYRRRVDSASWTAWERLDLDVEGEHLIPIVWNRRLHLFWPLFTEKAHPLQVQFTDGSLSGTEPQKYWEIRLAWSERKQGGWTGKRVSSQSINIDFFPRLMDDPAGFFFRTFVDGENNLHVLVLHSLTFLAVLFGPPQALAFRFDGCHAEPVVTRAWGNVMQFVTGTLIDRMYYREEGDRRLFLPAPADTAALARTPGTFLLLPYADGSSLVRHPFFYRDDKRTFFVIPSEVREPVWKWPLLDQVDPGSVAGISRFYWEKSVPFPDPLGPVIEPEDPWIFEPSFPVRPEVGGFQLAGNVRAGEAVARSAPEALSQAALGTNMVIDELSADVLSGLNETVHGWYAYRTENRFRFQTFYHPYVCAFVRELNRNGVDGLLQRRVQTHPRDFVPRAPGQPPPPPLDFRTDYEPHRVSSPVVIEPYPAEDVDFEEDGAYALYNWELFFHAPLMIADRLSKNQRYEEAQSWFHYVFDPTDTSSLPRPQRYWRTRPFHERTQEGYRRERLQTILRLLAAGASPEERAQLSAEASADLERFENTAAAWRKDPFNPHLIARMRTTAYQKTVVMKYLDNLIAWADQLFRRDTLESINEATQLYILAAEILGRRPEDIPPRANPRVATYNSLEPRLDAFSNALVQLEELVPPSAGGGPPVRAGQRPPLTLPGMLFFCVPRNDKLLAYWDTVADRLFKLRHCMNIEGVVRQLPLFEPPIDPGLLVKAAAAGVDLGSVLDDVSAAPSHYRFNVLAQKASELCAELKPLGQALLSALEKRDAERLSLLRAQHETALLALAQQVRRLQVDEAEQNKVALSRSRDMAVTRYVHHQKMLGVQSPKVPGIGQPIPEGSPSPQVAVQEEGGAKMIPLEKGEMQSLDQAHAFQQLASGLDLAANIAHLVPDANAQPFGVGATYGGSNVGQALSAYASYFRIISTQLSYEASRSGRLGQLALRAHGSLLDSNLAAREIMQIDQQFLAADLRKQIAERELANHRRQIDNAREMEELLRDKYTNQELYAWMLGQLATVYFQTYQLAYDLARRAERAFRYELGLQDSDFIQFGYWDSLKKGLLAGERLSHDLKRMEAAYLDQNRREYEITRHVSLTQLDPLALVQLRQTGACIARVPEALFDLDFPGHYMRRLKSVSVSIPCVTGPYTGVPCTLTLLRSSVRHAGTLRGGKYAREEGDPRFTDSVGAIQSVVTSNAQNDSGLFEANLRDERFLPFEGKGAIGEWQIELPAVFRPFDYDTISDVILHLRYTAREGGAPLRQQAALELQTALQQFLRTEGQQGLAQVFSPRHEMPAAWHRFLNGPSEAEGHRKLTLDLGSERFPYLFARRPLTVTAIELFLKVKEGFADSHNENTLALTLAAGDTAPTPETPEPNAGLLSLSSWNGLLRTAKGFANTPGSWTLHAWLEGENDLDPGAIQDILVVCRYTCS